MNRLNIMASIAAVMAAGSIAAAEADVAAVRRAEVAAKSGGMMERPGSSKGKVVFVNTQGDMAASNIVMAIKSLDDVIARYHVEVAESSPAKAGELKARFNADVAIVIAAEDDAPALLVAPGENWAVVNVRALAKNLKTESAMAKFYESRCRKEIMRGLVCASGGMGSSFPGNIMNVSSVEELDLCEEFIPFDKVSVIKQHLKACGVTPSRFATYRVACREGWAPAPTNDVQKAIWDKVRAIPAAPMKIEFDPKKGR